jgi:hypothetical protein
MVLLGAAVILQQDRCPPLSHTPRILAFGARNRQSPPRCGAPPRLRGFRLRSAEPRPRRRNTTSEGGQEDRRPARELANVRTVREALEHTRLSTSERQTGPRALSGPARLRRSTARGGEPGFQSRAATGRPLGHSRFEGQSRPYQDRSYAGLGSRLCSMNGFRLPTSPAVSCFGG